MRNTNFKATSMEISNLSLNYHHVEKYRSIMFILESYGLLMVTLGVSL